MNRRTTRTTLSLTLAAFCLTTCRESKGSPPVAVPQQVPARMDAAPHDFDPLKTLETSFPGSVTLKQNGRLLEFCPDNTCDGFLSSKCVPAATLKDFAYLYEYFFSGYTYLPTWRSRPEAKDAAKRVLSQAKWKECGAATGREKARCILLNLSRNGRIKLLFIRYDEGHRNVGTEDLVRELMEKKPAGER